ncbi:hypothetical protein FQN57_002499 [Myotisia sp. PD_48]|nr:hypothetical protein FQN57_002499 [Myotisia sp. PD_48]
MSSYGTSLNLLFFYITWATLVLSHSPLRVEIVGTVVIRFFLYFIPSLIFFLFDLFLPSAATALKKYGKDGLPQKRKKKVGNAQLKVAAWSTFNLGLGIVAQGMVELGFTKGLGIKSALKVSTRLPLPWSIVKDILRALLIREVLQYVLHRYMLHSKGTWLAKRHAEWYHSIHTPYPLTAHYDHPAVYLFSHFIPTFFPVAVFRSHLLSYMLYLAIISLEETFTYSGYKSIPTSFFTSRIAKHVDAHLFSDGGGNFAPWGIMDWIFGTNIKEDSSDISSDESDDVSVNGIERQGVMRVKGNLTNQCRARRP